MNTRTDLIGEMVAEDFRTAAVFKKYGIDFCCRGGRTIEDACKDSNLYRRLLTTNVDETEEEPKLHAMLALIASAYLVDMRFITEEAVCAVTTLVSSEPTES